MMFPLMTQFYQKKILRDDEVNEQPVTEIIEDINKEQLGTDQSLHTGNPVEIVGHGNIEIIHELPAWM